MKMCGLSHIAEEPQKLMLTGIGYCCLFGRTSKGDEVEITWFALLKYA